MGMCAIKCRPRLVDDSPIEIAKNEPVADLIGGATGHQYAIDAMRRESQSTLLLSK
jgi:hypothetical protein